jgi:hypothetical protein
MRSRMIAFGVLALIVGSAGAGDPAPPLPLLRMEAWGDCVRVQWDGFQAVARRVSLDQAKNVLTLEGRPDRPVEFSGDGTTPSGPSNVRARKVTFNFSTNEMSGYSIDSAGARN